MLTNATVKAARPGARPYKLADAGGLHLLVRPSGSKAFRMKFRRGGKEQLLTIGTWPETSLADARARRDLAREQLRGGGDPSKKSSNLCIGGETIEDFEHVARRWHAEQAPHWSAKHSADVLAGLERDVFPAIGAAAPGSIRARDILGLLRAVETRGCIETARRQLERIAGVFRLAILEEQCETNPAAIVADRLSPRPLQRPQPALTELDDGRALYRAQGEVAADAIARLGAQLLALTAVRMSALRFAELAEFEDLGGDAPRWRIPPGRMKLTKVRKGDPAAEHVVPLSRQAVLIVFQLIALAGGGPLLLPGRRHDRPIGEGAIGAVIARTAFAGRHVPHGWRATFSTLLNDRFPGDRALIDQALAHAGDKKQVEAAYNRATHEARMRDLFQRWADLIDPS